MWKLLGKVRMNIYTALLSFLNFYCFKPIISKVQTIAKLEPFCIPTCSYIAVVAFLLILISCVKIIEFIVLSAVSYRAAGFKPEGRGGGRGCCSMFAVLAFKIKASIILKRTK